MIMTAENITALARFLLDLQELDAHHDLRLEFPAQAHIVFPNNAAVLELDRRVDDGGYVVRFPGLGNIVHSPKRDTGDE